MIDEWKSGFVYGTLFGLVVGIIIAWMACTVGYQRGKSDGFHEAEAMVQPLLDTIHRMPGGK